MILMIMLKGAENYKHPQFAKEARLRVVVSLSATSQ